MIATETKLLLALTISGNCPSKKNDKQRVMRGGKLFMVPNARHQRWEQARLTDLWNLHPRMANDETVQIQERCGIIATIYPESLRKSDLTNKMESVMDLLVKAKILKDDNWFETPEVQIKFGGKDAANPRVEVLIYQLSGMTALDGFVAGLRQQIRVEHTT